MRYSDAVNLEPGTKVLETEYGLVGRFVRVGAGSREIEVDHDYDGGGFDFWPLESTQVWTPRLERDETRGEAIRRVASIRTHQFRCWYRHQISRLPGVNVWQHGWSIGRHHRLQLSVDRRMRAARFSTEHFVGESGYQYWNICWASPTVHRWWARSITVSWR